MHVVFVSYHSFASNSAAQLLSLANHLVRRGLKCTAFIPFDKETALPHGKIEFDVRTFIELDAWVAETLPAPTETLLVAWTPRENVRNFTTRFLANVPCRYVVHLEDNELLITAANLGMTVRELRQTPVENLDARLASDERLSHPYRFPEFIADSAGITALIDRLAEFAPRGHPCCVFWPGYNPDFFQPAPVDLPRRRKLGIGDEEVVLAYTGNVHAANRQEVFSLYLAVRVLNRIGVPSRLIRAGEDHAQLLNHTHDEIRTHVIELGKVPHFQVPGILAMANVLVQPGRADDFNEYRFPSKVPEFFAIGRPVIIPAANLGRFVHDAVDCLVLKRGDSLEIAELVARLHESPETADRLAAAAQRFAEQHFRWATIAERIESFYRQLLAVIPTLCHRSFR